MRDTVEKGTCQREAIGDTNGVIPRDRSRLGAGRREPGNGSASILRSQPGFLFLLSLPRLSLPLRPFPPSLPLPPLPPFSLLIPLPVPAPALLLRVPSFPRNPQQCLPILAWIRIGRPGTSTVSMPKSWLWVIAASIRFPALLDNTRAHDHLHHHRHHTPAPIKGVGKTSLLQRYTQNKFDPKNTTSTTGAFFVAKKVTVNGVKVRLQLWDTAGQERFRSMVCIRHWLIAIYAHFSALTRPLPCARHSQAPMYYRGANAALLLYDITNQVSFRDVRGWLKGEPLTGPNALIRSQKKIPQSQADHFPF